MTGKEKISDKRNSKGDLSNQFELLKAFMKKILFLFSLLSLSTSLLAEQDDGVYEVSETCGTTKVRLSCDQKSTKCKRVDMFFQPKSEIEKEIKLPLAIKKEKNLFPMRFGCHISHTKKVFVIVQYDNLIVGCKICEIFYIYDDQGNALTKSDPVFLKLAPNEGNPAYPLYPNNKEFEKMAVKINFNMDPSMTNDFQYIYIPFTY